MKRKYILLLREYHQLNAASLYLHICLCNDSLCFPVRCSRLNRVKRNVFSIYCTCLLRVDKGSLFSLIKPGWLAASFWQTLHKYCTRERSRNWPSKNKWSDLEEAHISAHTSLDKNNHTAAYNLSGEKRNSYSEC